MLNDTMAHLNCEGQRHIGHAPPFALTGCDQSLYHRRDFMGLLACRKEVCEWTNGDTPK